MKLDEANGKKAWTGSEIKEAYRVAERTTSLLEKRFMENGLGSTLERQKQANRHHKVTGEVEAQMIAIACSEAPAGSSKWTLQMIADKLLELKVNEIAIIPKSIGNLICETYAIIKEAYRVLKKYGVLGRI